MELTRINPQELGAPKGYSNGVLVRGGKLLFIAGQIAWDAHQKLVGDGDFARQFDQAMRNVLAVVQEAGGGPEGLCELTMFVTDKQAYVDRVKEIGAVWRELCGKHFPAMALVEVAGLLEPGAMIEIRGIAAIP